MRSLAPEAFFQSTYSELNGAPTRKRKSKGWPAAGFEHEISYWNLDADQRANSFYLKLIISVLRR